MSTINKYVHAPALYVSRSRMSSTVLGVRPDGSEVWRISGFVLSRQRARCCVFQCRNSDVRLSDPAHKMFYSCMLGFRNPPSRFANRCFSKLIVQA